MESLEALGQGHGALSTVHLYLHALEDGVVSFGEYHTDDKDIEKAKKRKALLFTWSMDSPQYEASWGHPSS